MRNKKEKTEKTPKKKRKLSVGKVILIILLVLIIAMLGVVGSSVIMNQNFTVSFYQITSDKVSNNIRIVELSDLHNAEYGKDNSKLVSKIESLHPDLIVYAGDMMNEKNNDYSVMFDLSDKLCKIAPIYACYGNNELDQQLFYDDSFKNQLKEHNVTLLSNEAKNVEVGNTTLQLIAISDNVKQYDVKTNNAKKFVEALEPTSNCRICLTHYPELFVDKLLDKNIDIAFTGHAHGGQIRLPYLGGLYSPGEGFLPRFSEGVVEADDGTKVVVSRGLGNSSEIFTLNNLPELQLPRINNQPELVVVDVCWY